MDKEARLRQIETAPRKPQPRRRLRPPLLQPPGFFSALFSPPPQSAHSRKTESPSSFLPPLGHPTAALQSSSSAQSAGARHRLAILLRSTAALPSRALPAS